MRFAVLALLLITTGIRPALAEGPFVGFDLGAGDLDIDGVDLGPDFDLGLGTSDNVGVIHFTGGYEFESGLFLAGSYEEFDTITILGLGDGVELDAFKLGVGYAIPTADKFRLIGEIGLAFWDLEARESFLFNPGPEASAGLDDNDIYANFGVEIFADSPFRLSIIYNYNNYDFGDASAWRVGVRYHFR